MRLSALIIGAALLIGCKAAEAPTAPIAPSVPDASGSVTGDVQPPASPRNLPTGRMEDIDFAAYSEELAGGLDLQMGENRLDSIDKIRLFFSPEPGVNMVNMTSATFEGDDGSVMLFARNNLPDDSIHSQEVYAVFSGAGGADKFNQKLAAFGMRIKCRRGENKIEWTTELCP